MELAGNLDRIHRRVLVSTELHLHLRVCVRACARACVGGHLSFLHPRLLAARPATCEFGTSGSGWDPK